MRRLGWAASALTLAAVALAGADDGDRPRRANLDSDPELERVLPQQVCEATDGSIHLPQPSCAGDQFSRLRIVIEDVCAGEPHLRTISTIQDYVDDLRVTELDGRADRPEIFFTIRSGATGRGGEMRVVRYGESGGTCPGVHGLFRFPTKSTLGRIPRGAVGRVNFYAFPYELRKRFPGKELRLVETYVDRNDSFCCPSFRRVTLFRFDRDRDRYVRYRTRVRRIRGGSRRHPPKLAPGR